MSFMCPGIVRVEGGGAAGVAGEEHGTRNTEEQGGAGAGALISACSGIVRVQEGAMAGEEHGTLRRSRAAVR